MCGVDVAHGHQASCKDGGGGGGRGGTLPSDARGLPPRPPTQGRHPRQPHPAPQARNKFTPPNSAALPGSAPPLQAQGTPPGPRAGNLLRGGDGVWAPEVRTETLWARNQLGKGSASAWGERGSRGTQPRPGSPHTCSQDSRPAPTWPSAPDQPRQSHLCWPQPRPADCYTPGGTGQGAGHPRTERRAGPPLCSQPHRTASGSSAAGTSAGRGERRAEH